MKKSFSEPERLSPCFVNICRKIINNLSMVYCEDAAREVEGTTTDHKIFTEISESTALSMKMKTASRYTKLLKTVLIRPVWRNDAMDLDILTGDILDVQTGDTPENLESILVHPLPGNRPQG